MTYSLQSILQRGLIVTLALVLALLPGCSSQISQDSGSDTVIISVVGTNDVHGQLVAQSGRGGLSVFSGYVNALRAKGAEDNGAVLLIDAGDMWQGTLESNLSEGAVMVEAFNALGYTAATIGNHEFDFGPEGERSTPGVGDDARGALKARATEAKFPLLAANLIDIETGRLVDWPNVQPSVMVDASGIKVGIIGVMTFDALKATIAANVRGLRVAPLAPSIIEEAQKLRAQGAALVIVTAHAGGSCSDFEDPYDLSSCDKDDEIMQVARALPKGLVDQIIAGHQHRGIAHFVNDVAVTSSFSSTRGFGRVDFAVNTANQSLEQRKIYPPKRPCPFTQNDTGNCAWENTGDVKVSAARYEDKLVTPDPIVKAIVERAKRSAQELKATKLGVYLETEITLENKPEAALGNLMTDALLQTSDADISIHNVSGGIRANLTQGDLTFGKIYQMFPFDNRVVLLELTGAELRRVMAEQAHKKERRAGFSGMSVHVQCINSRMNVRMVRPDGSDIGDDDLVRVAVNDFLALGGDGILTPIIPAGGFQYPSDTALARDAVIEWLSNGRKRINASMFLGESQRRWHMSESLPAGCSL